MAKRLGTASDHRSDGVSRPVDDIEEITDRIELLDIPKNGKMGSGELGRVLASFESQLIELNQTLRGSTTAELRKLRAECKMAEEEVHDLNSELNIVVKGETG